MNFSWDKIWGYINKYAGPFVKCLLILLIGHFIIKYIVKLVNKGFSKSKLDQSLATFLLKAVNIVLHVLIVLSALSSIGVSTTGIVAAFSAAAVAVSLALKDSLSNVAGGILLLFTQRFSTGDYVAVAGDEGTVTNVDLFHTTIRTLDNKMVSIPNSLLINNHIINYSKEAKRRVDIVFSIPYEADANKAKDIIKDTICKHSLVINDPDEPFVRVLEYAESSVNIVTRTWCNTPDYWTLYFDINEQVRESLSKEGINIPYNKLDVHIKHEN